MNPFKTQQTAHQMRSQLVAFVIPEAVGGLSPAQFKSSVGWWTRFIDRHLEDAVKDEGLCAASASLRSKALFAKFAERALEIALNGDIYLQDLKKVHPEFRG